MCDLQLKTKGPTYTELVVPSTCTQSRK